MRQRCLIVILMVRRNYVQFARNWVEIIMGIRHGQGVSLLER